VDKKKDGKTVNIITTAPEGILLIKNLKHMTPRWKLPSGHVQKGETSVEVAMRELEKKTGIIVNITDKNKIRVQEYKDDLKSIYLVNFSNSFTNLHKMRTKWELIEIFLPKEIRFMGMNQVVPEHYRLLEFIELI